MSYKERRDKFCNEQGDRHAVPIIRSMYPSKSRGEMAKEFSQVGLICYDAGRADTLKLADEILVNKIKERLSSWGDEDGKPLKNIGSYSQLLNALLAWQKAKEE